jgi:hypothetical protein
VFFPYRDIRRVLGYRYGKMAAQARLSEVFEVRVESHAPAGSMADMVFRLHRERKSLIFTLTEKENFTYKKNGRKLP